MFRYLIVFSLTLCALACSSQDSTDVDASVFRELDIRHAALVVDYGTRSGTATIELVPPSGKAAQLDIGTLDILGTKASDKSQPEVQGDTLVVDSQSSLITIDVDFTFKLHPSGRGADAKGLTLTWPYFCGNLFPCNPQPKDGLTFSLDLQNLPTGQRAVYPNAIAADAPPYMLAWAVGAYTELTLGTTKQGTQISVWYLPGQRPSAMTGTASLVDAFNWLELTLGPYPFGKKVASVSADWGVGAFGGMEHHPYWHVASEALADQTVHIHEAAHGWYGNGVRIACWEDFVLSEGTADYLTARIISKQTGTDDIWQDYRNALETLQNSNQNKVAWPNSCGKVDILDGLFGSAPYVKGALFLKAVADRIGAEALDGVLRDFFLKHNGDAAGMQDLLDAIQADTGWDPNLCAQQWLRSELPGPEKCAGNPS